MGIKERQERDRETVRRAILDAARDLFTTEGYKNVSIRKIAERIEYSPAAIYGYFPSKDDIFFALAEEGVGLLGVAVLSLSERLAAGEDRDSLASDVIDTTLAGLQTALALKSTGVALDCVHEPIAGERASERSSASHGQGHGLA